MSVIVNKEILKDSPEVYQMLLSLEKALKSKDSFSVSVLITRLEGLGLKFKKATLKESSDIQ